MTQKKPSQRGSIRHWTLDQVVWWMSTGTEPEDAVPTGERCDVQIGRLLAALREGRIPASGIVADRRQDLSPVEWLDLDISAADVGLGFADGLFVDEFPVSPLIARSIRVVPVSAAAGRLVPAGRMGACGGIAFEGFFRVVEAVFLQADHVRAVFPPPPRSAAEQTRACEMAATEIRRILGASPDLRLLSDRALRNHVVQRAATEGGRLSQADFRRLKEEAVRSSGARAWTMAGAPLRRNQVEIERKLRSLGLPHLIESSTIDPK